jgi:hypothetical protein
MSRRWTPRPWPATANLTSNIVAMLVVGRWVQAIDPAYAGRVMSERASSAAVGTAYSS